MHFLVKNAEVENFAMYVTNTMNRVGNAVSARDANSATKITRKTHGEIRR